MSSKVKILARPKGYYIHFSRYSYDFFQELIGKSHLITKKETLFGNKERHWYGIKPNSLFLPDNIECKESQSELAFRGKAVVVLRIGGLIWGSTDPKEFADKTILSVVPLQATSGNSVGYSIEGYDFLESWLDTPWLSELIAEQSSRPFLIRLAWSEDEEIRGEKYLFKNHILCRTTTLVHNSIEEVSLDLLEALDKDRKAYERLKTKFTVLQEQVQCKREPIPEEVRIAVWHRDGGKCVRCGSKEKLEYDHIIPVSKGGSNTLRNIELLCEACNRSKSGNIQ